MDLKSMPESFQMREEEPWTESLLNISRTENDRFVLTPIILLFPSILDEKIEEKEQGFV